MKSSKLIQCLSTFSESEWKEFEKIILPRFLHNEKLCSFFYCLKKAAPDFKPNQIEKQIIFPIVFGKSISYQDIKIRELTSLLYKYVGDFLIYKETHQHDFYRELYLLQQFRKRKLNKHFEIQQKQLEKIIKKDKLVNIESYKRKFLLEKERFQQFDEQQIREHEPYLQSKIDNLDYYYFATKLRESCEMLARFRVINQPYKVAFIEDVLNVINLNSSLKEIPSIATYFSIYILLKTDEDENQFDNTVLLVDKNRMFFSTEEQRYVYNHLLNYCIDQINAGNKVFIKKMFAIQKRLLKTKLFLQKNTLSHISYKNIVSIAIKLKEYNWTNKFIEEYKEYILPKYRENAYNLSRANVLYEQEKYNETIVLLNQVEFTDVYYACSAKYLLCKAYYMLQEYETLDYFITAFQLFLKRGKEISSAFKKASDNFLKILKGLVQIRRKKDYLEEEKVQHKIGLLEQKIDALKSIANKTWLIEQIDALK